MDKIEEIISEYAGLYSDTSNPLVTWEDYEEHYCGLSDQFRRELEEAGLELPSGILYVTESAESAEDITVYHRVNEMRSALDYCHEYPSDSEMTDRLVSRIEDKADVSKNKAIEIAARAVGVSKRTIQNYLRGEVRTPATRLDKIKEVYNEL